MKVPEPSHQIGRGVDLGSDCWPLTPASFNESQHGSVSRDKFSANHRPSSGHVGNLSQSQTEENILLVVIVIF